MLRRIRVMERLSTKAQTGCWTRRLLDLMTSGHLVCIFLEVLLWTTGLGKGGPDEFAEQRLRYQDDARGNGRSTKFWCVTSWDGANFRLDYKPIVTDWFKRLKRYCRGRGVFEDVVKTTKSMRKLNPKSRTKAHSVANDFAAILKAATRDLRDDPEFYLRDKPHFSKKSKSYKSSRVAAPLSDVSSQRSRSQSVDNRSDQGLNGRFLTPTSPAISHQKRSHKKKTESIPVNIPFPEINREYIAQANMILPEITVISGESSDDDDDLQDLLSDASQPGSPILGSPQILLGEGSMASRGRFRNVLDTLQDAESSALQPEMRDMLGREPLHDN